MKIHVEKIDLFWFTKKQITEHLEYINNNYHCFEIKINPFDPESVDLNIRFDWFKREARQLGMMLSDNGLIAYSHE